MFKIYRAIALSMLSGTAFAAPIDLSSWSALTLDFPGGQPAGNWVLSADKLSVTQTVNADPSFYLNNLNQTSYTMNGTWRVNTSADDDYMGFVFGYQDSSNFYLFDWKQVSQGYVGTNAAEGMSVKKFEGATGNGLVDLSLDEFWENEGPTYGDMTVLATNHGSDKGWKEFTDYGFKLDFNIVAGEFSITVTEGATTLWNTTIVDSTFTSGMFGFYNYSQQNVAYAGFEQEGGVIIDDPDDDDPVVSVPEPASIALLGLGLLGLRVRRRLQV